MWILASNKIMIYTGPVICMQLGERLPLCRRLFGSPNVNHLVWSTPGASISQPAYASFVPNSLVSNKWIRSLFLPQTSWQLIQKVPWAPILWLVPTYILIRLVSKRLSLEQRKLFAEFDASYRKQAAGHGRMHCLLEKMAVGWYGRRRGRLMYFCPCCFYLLISVYLAHLKHCKFKMDKKITNERARDNKREKEGEMDRGERERDVDAGRREVLRRRCCCWGC